MHSCGNTFIIHINFKKKIKKILFSNKYCGLFYDQEILLTDYFKKIFYIRIFNNDGSEAKNCLNGLRSIAKLIFKKINIRKIKIKVFNSLYNFYLIKNKIFSKIKNVRNSIKKNSINFLYRKFFIKNNKNFYFIKNLYNFYYFVSLNIGNKHVLLEKNSILKVKKFLYKNKILSNFNISKFDNKKKIIKTYENSVGYTNSCGSATASLLFIQHLCCKRKKINVYNNYGVISYLKKKNFFYIYSLSNYISFNKLKL
ncbi:hypothetical protein [Candidatus Vidania fulgoroideorum]